MRHVPLLLAACLLAALAGGAWLLGDGDSLPPPAEAGSFDPERGPDATSPPDPVATDAADRETAEPQVAEVGASAADDDAEDDTERSEVVVGDRRAATVRVVRGEPPQPVPEALVYFISEAEAARQQARAGRELVRWEWPEAFGQRAVTDAAGEVRLPLGEAPWCCSAVAFGDFAFAMVPPRPRTTTLVLAADETITLQARVQDGRPAAGVPLAVLQQFDEGEARPIWRGHADAEGQARLRHFQLQRENRPGAPASERFAALATVPGSAAVAFAGRPATTDPVALLVPPLGTLRVQCVDHAGTPILSRATIGLAAWQPPAFTVASAFKLPGNLVAPRVAKPPGEAPVELPWQLVAEPLRLFARYPLERRPNELGPVPGPTEPGAVATAIVGLREEQTVLAGRFVLADGSPVGDIAVAGSIWGREREVLALSLDPIADGRFDVVLTGRDVPGAWLELRLDPAALPAPRAAPGGETTAAPVEPLGARVPLPPLQASRRVELGTIVLTTLPTLAEGVVVDDRGEPVAAAAIELQQEERPAGRERNRDPWRTLPLYRTRTGPDGQFRLVGELLPGRLRVRADTDRHFADSVALGRQGEQLRIVIARNGILRGRVLLPDWLPDGTASLQLRPLDESLRARDTKTIDLSRRRGGRFTVEPLRPGRFDALVLVRNLPTPLAVLPDVFVTPGETREARLQPLDLREALHRYRLRAVDAAGQPFPLDGPIAARLQQPDGSPAEVAFRWQRGRAELITTAPTAELVFFGRGHQTVRQLFGAGDHDVRLVATRPAAVELPGLRALCGPLRKVRISALLQGEPGLPAIAGGVDQRTGERFGFQRWDLGRSSGGWLGATDVVEIPLVVPGKYELLLRPHATDTERSPQGQLSLGVFELTPDSTSWEPRRVSIDATAVLAMLQKLDQDHAAQVRRQAERGQNRPAGR